MNIFKKFHKIGELQFTMPEIQVVPHDQDTAKCLAAIKEALEKKFLQSLSIPAHMLSGATTYSSASADALVYALAAQKRAERRKLEERRRREEALWMIWGRLQAAWIKGNIRNLATSLWMAEECFDRSLDVLARYHRLGVWRFRRLA